MKQAGQMKKQQQQHQIKQPAPPLPQQLPTKPQIPIASSTIAITKKPTNIKNKSASIVGRDPRGRKKKKADDTLPKHPMSAYLHFAKEMRPIMKKRFPDARLVEISKEIGNEWRAMAQIDLQKWMDMANVDKARYAKEMKERYIQSQQQQQQQQENITVNDDAQSFRSSSISSETSSSASGLLPTTTVTARKRKFSSISSTSTISTSNNSTTNNAVIDDLDSDIIATVAQMVNANANSNTPTKGNGSRG